MSATELRSALVRIAWMTSRAPHRSLPVFAEAVEAIRAHDAEEHYCDEIGHGRVPHNPDIHRAESGARP